jgi:tetratricopeptide (TPR) repeat protein
MCDALEYFLKALYPIMQKDTLTEDEENLIMNNLSQCYRIEHIVAYYPTIKIRNKLTELVDRVLRRCNTTVSQLDEDTRTCYAGLNMDSPTLVINFLNSCKQKYPKSIYFFELSASMNGFLGQYDSTLYETNLGLEIDPNYCPLLYDKAGALRLLEKDMNEAIEAYRAFLAVAPKDHRKVPDSYYAMSMCYLMSKNDQSLENATKMYQKGEEAEKLQLPCFLPYDQSIKTPIKLAVDLMSSIKKKLSTLDIDK